MNPSQSLHSSTLWAILGLMLGSRTETENLLRRYYDAFNQGDGAAMLALLHPDIVHDINQGDSVAGVEAFGRFLEHMDECYEEQVEDLVVFASESGERAAAEFFIRGRYLSTDEGLPAAKGQNYHLRVGAFIEVEGGLIKRVTNYYNMQDWIRQVSA